MQTDRLNRRRLVKLWVALLSIAAIPVAAVVASSKKETVHETYCVPGVDEYGCLSYRKSSPVCFKVCYDYKKKECYAIGRGEVCNESECDQKYHDICLIPDYSDCYRTVDWTSDCYEVWEDGCCRGRAWGSVCYNDNGYENDSKSKSKKSKDSKKSKSSKKSKKSSKKSRNGVS